jgi:hypothetical protein
MDAPHPDLHECCANGAGPAYIISGSAVTFGWRRDPLQRKRDQRELGQRLKRQASFASLTMLTVAISHWDLISKDHRRQSGASAPGVRPNFHP